MSKKQIIVVSAVLVVLALFAVVLAVLFGTDPDIPPEPLVTTERPDAGVLVLEAGDEDAGGDAEAGAAPKGPGAGSKRASKLITCCRVLAQNAKSVADPVTRASMIQAASMCEASARTGQYDAVEDVLDKYDVPCD
ncbi:MAG: hypothetical protein ACOC1F_07135 [Myxococcota bacterium]